MAIFWKNEDGCVDHACSDLAVPIIGKFRGNEEYSQIKWIADRQECAFDYDCYFDDQLTDYYSDEEKRRIIIQNRDQKPSGRIGEVYYGVPVLNIPQGLELLGKTADNGRINNSQVFLPSTTPNYFKFSGTFLLNNGFQGALHTFLRHNPQWQEILPFVGEALKRMESVKTLLFNITNAYGMSQARSATYEFLRALEGKDVKEFNAIQSALNDVQVEMVKCLMEKMTYNNYRGEGVNEKGQLQTFFQVKQDLVAMIGYSRELFERDTSIDPRPLRTIITIYFINDAECDRRSIMKSY